MSLNFNYSRCANVAELVDPADPAKMHPVTTAVIWNMMAIDMGAITADNVDEVWYRTNLHSLTSGSCALHYNSGERFYLTRSDIERHVGLTTNVSTKTRLQWVTKTYGNKNSANWVQDRPQLHSAMAHYAERVRETQKENA